MQKLIRIKQHSAWKTQLFVIQALVKREIVTRFGKYKLGAIWMLIDPLAQVIMLGLILGPLLGRTSGIIPYPFFLLCGFMLLSLVTGPINAGLGAISSNQGLLIFKQVLPIDPFIARFGFEFVTTILAFSVFCILGAWFGIPISLSHIPELLYALFITWVIGSSLGLFFGIACNKFTELEKIVSYIQRPLLYISGILFPLSAVPNHYAQFLLLNPLTHTVEYARICLFPDYHADGVNLYYPTGFAVVTLALALMLYRNNRHDLTQK